jgi:hypothetical protein
MAVEALTIVNGPLAGMGIEENGIVDQTTAWMHQNGIKPTYVGIGAVAGALLGKSGAVDGAVKGAALVFVGSFLLHKLR